MSLLIRTKLGRILIVAYHSVISYINNHMPCTTMLEDETELYNNYDPSDSY